MGLEQSKLKFNQAALLSRVVNQPPFYFRGVTMRVFPVRANLATLREFCDTYINFVPGEIARYEPFVPFVYVCLINYGRMQQIQDAGWVAQNEMKSWNSQPCHTLRFHCRGMVKAISFWATQPASWICCIRP